MIDLRARTLRARNTLAAALVVALAGAGSAQADVTTSPHAGIEDRTPHLTVFTHARLVVKPGTVIDDGTLVVRDGVVVASGAKVAVPSGAASIDLGGRTVFPGLIDAESDYAQPTEDAAAAGKPSRRAEATPYMPTPQPGSRHWNAHVHPEADLALELKPDAKKADALRKLGFTSVLSTPTKGVFRGQAALLDTRETTRLNDALVAPHVAQQVAFEQGNWPSDEYPTSLMGATALIRQTLLDARWQQQRLGWLAKNKNAERSEANLALDALAPVIDGRQPVMFATQDELDYDRALALAHEFKFKLVLEGNGHEYRRAAALKQSGVPIVLPLNYPEAPAIEDGDRALDVSLSELEHWELAPFNARVLAEAGVPFAFTANGLKKPEEQFWANVRKAVANGLDENAALAALTSQPATMLGVADRVGTLEPGRLANFIIADADFFRSDKARIYEVRIGDRRYQLADADRADPRGTWTLTWTGATGPASIELSGELNDLSAKAGDTSFPAVLGDGELSFFPPGKLFGSARDRVAVTAALSRDAIDGRATIEGGRELRVVGTRTKSAERIAEAAKPKPPLPATAARYPAGEFGRLAPPAQPAAVLVRHATIWTQGPQGKIDDGDMLVEKGKIVAIGKDLKLPNGASEIDAHGKHLAPGIIDPHSHMANARGTNESSHAVTSEVRIADSLDPTDMTLYRQLAGGVTAAQILHGSANPIGGQSQIIKLRWGEGAEALKFAAAPPTIKFALGENVKQANWGDAFNKRYPQTRMGVQQIDLDSLMAGEAYGEKLAKHKDSDEPFRRDLRLEALAEIVQGKRYIQIHSYRQDEILAFVETARRFHIVPVFQHVLEGYKVADAIASIGAGASTFSDWWAYKMEVIDAIPYNGALMTRQGVTVTFNSDSDELGRRLNAEAAKAVKYGGLSETEAFNLVTINAAKQLHVDRYVGSLEVGKDADFAIWNASPLSTMAYPEQTWIDGRKFFDRNDDIAERDRIDAERARLVAKILPERVKALAKKDVPGKPEKKETPDAPPKSIEAATAQLVGLRTPYHNDEPVDTCTIEESRQ